MRRFFYILLLNSFVTMSSYALDCAPVDLLKYSVANTKQSILRAKILKNSFFGKPWDSSLKNPAIELQVEEFLAGKIISEKKIRVLANRWDPFLYTEYYKEGSSWVFLIEKGFMNYSFHVCFHGYKVTGDSLSRDCRAPDKKDLTYEDFKKKLNKATQI